MTRAELKVLSHVLSMAADEFSNHGCNDLHLVKDTGLKEDESLDFQRVLHEWAGDTDADPPKQGRHYTQDWIVMRHFADRIKRYAEQMPDTP